METTLLVLCVMFSFVALLVALYAVGNARERDPLLRAEIIEAVEEKMGQLLETVRRLLRTFAEADDEKIAALEQRVAALEAKRAPMQIGKVPQVQVVPLKTPPVAEEAKQPEPAEAASGWEPLPTPRKRGGRRRS